jgi:hypothetical protein
MRLGEFLAADRAVMIAIEPVEHMLAHLLAAMLAHCVHLVRRDPAVMVGVETGEPLLDIGDDLLAGDVAIRAGAGAAGPRLGQSDAGGSGEQRRSGQKNECLHGRSFLCAPNITRSCWFAVALSRNFVAAKQSCPDLSQMVPP